MHAPIAFTGSHPARHDGCCRVFMIDLCDLRCRYCMAETTMFLPRTQLATLDELALIMERLIPRGVRKVRLSGRSTVLRCLEQ